MLVWYFASRNFIPPDPMDDGNFVTTKLLTLLNVSATKIGKRKRTYEEHFVPTNKLNKRKSASFVVADEPVQREDADQGGKAGEGVDMDSVAVEEGKENAEDNGTDG
jgi:U3 small nucleolar RNA-associated protein 25